MTSATVAVTGASGYLGQFVCQDLIARGYQVHALSREEPRLTLPGVDWLVGSLQSDAVVAQLTSGAQHVVHCALQHAPGRFRGGEGDDPVGFWQQNLLATLALLEACVANQVQSCVLISSRAVFDDHLSREPLTDNATPRPSTHYGVLKATEELLAYRYSASTSLQVRCLRSTGIFGLVQPLARSKWYELVHRVLSVAPHESLPLSSRQVTEVHGADAAAAVQLLLQPLPDSAPISFNCSDICVSEQQLATRIAELARVPLKPNNQTTPEAPVGPMLDCRNLRQLGWQPQGATRLPEVLTQLISAH